MKVLFLIIGIVFLFLGIMQSYQYIFDYSLLNEYGKGYIWGNIILVLLGIIFIGIYIKKRKK